MRRTASLLLPVLLCVSFLGAAQPVAAAASTAQVGALDDYFSPANVSVPRGGTVTWDFVGSSHHTVTDISGLGLYDSGSVGPGGPSTSFTFVAAGVYPFNCTFHDQMAGRVSVPLRAMPALGSRRRTFTITWASTDAPVGFVYDVQLKRPKDVWRRWQTGATIRMSAFDPRSGAGAYRFRSRMRSVGTDAAARWSDMARITVR